MAATTTTTTTTTTIIIIIAAAVHFSPTNADRNNLEKFLGPHNVARAVLGLPPLAWDARLARYASSYARKRRRDCALVHSDGPYGENIFWGSGSGWTAAQAVKYWAAERVWYDYRGNSCAPGQKCGHYTQMVWRGTRRLGCDMVNCFGGRGVFVVCSYDPPGNYVGERPY